MQKHLTFALHFLNLWGLRRKKFLLLHYDEKWFWGLVLRRNAKACKELGIERTNLKAFHKGHINKTMGIAVVGAAFEGSLLNGCTGVKVAFARSQMPKVADRMVRGVRERGDVYIVDCAVTGSSYGTVDDPKFPLEDFFRVTVFPEIDSLVRPGGRYEGYTPVIQGDNAGPHESGTFQTYVKDYCDGMGWHWEPQAPQMPHANVCDLSVFPNMSKRHSELARGIGGLKVLSKDETWGAAEKVWGQLDSPSIASGFIHCHKILEKVREVNGKNDFLGSGGSIHFGVRKGLEQVPLGLVPKVEGP